MNASTLIQKLRKEVVSIAGDNLPAEIRYQDRYGNVVIKPLFDAYSKETGVQVRFITDKEGPLMARLKIPGTVRASFSVYNDDQDVERLLAALKKAKEMLS
mgnify:CR=1 FL=1